MKKILLPLFSTFISLLMGLLLGSVIAAFADENPLHILQIIWNSGLGSKYDLGTTLYYANALALTGYSVAVAFHAGLFNIGAEGQLNMATLMVAIVGLTFPNVSPFLGIIISFSVAMMAGALWAGIAGLLKAYRGGHEVISTIMLNIIASALASWLITLPVLRNTENQNPETRQLSLSYFVRGADPLVKFFMDSPTSSSILIIFLLAILLWAFLFRTRTGFAIRATGQNEVAAELAGLNPKLMKVIAMLIAGACAGLVAIGEVNGHTGKFLLGFSPEFGFMGIAVALLARNQPLAIPPAAFLFAILHKGAGDLDIETKNITRDLAVVIQAVVVLSISISPWLEEKILAFMVNHKWGAKE